MSTFRNTVIFAAVVTVGYALFSLNAQAISYAKRTWTLEHAPELFVHDVVRSCLTSRSSKVQSQEKEITLQDDRACGDQIQSLSQLWDKSQISMASVNTRFRDPAKLKSALSEKFGKTSSEELKILPLSGDHSKCPCLIFTGTKSVEAAEYLKTLYPTKKGGTPLKLELRHSPIGSPSTSPSISPSASPSSTASPAQSSKS